MTNILYNKTNILGLFSSQELLNETINSLVRNNFVKTSDLNVVKYKDNCISSPDQVYNISLVSNNLFKNGSSNNNLQKNINNSHSFSTIVDSNSFLIEDFSSNDTTESTSIATEELNEINELENEIAKINCEQVLDVVVEEKKKESNKQNQKIQEKRSKIDYNLNILKKKKEQLEEQKRVFEVDLDLYNKFNKIKNENDSFIIPDIFLQKYNIFKVLHKDNTINLEVFNKLYKKDNTNTKWDNKLFSGDGKDRELLNVTESDDNNDDINDDINDDNNK